MLKPTLGELSSLSGIEKIDMGNVEEVAKELILKNRCEVIVVSLGSEGALLVTKSKAYWTIPPEVDRKSTVGAGDSMLAGIVYSLSSDINLKQALQYGVACGTAATMHPGTELAEKKMQTDSMHQYRKHAGINLS